MGHDDLELQVRDLLNKPYLREIVPTDDGVWFASAPELRGCITEGDNAADAAQMLEDAMGLWFRTAIELGRPIPEPRQGLDRRHSGRFNLRVPKRLHRTLANQAAENQVSLNEYCVYLLSTGTGRRQGSLSGTRFYLNDFLAAQLSKLAIKKTGWLDSWMNESDSAANEQENDDSNTRYFNRHTG